VVGRIKQVMENIPLLFLFYLVARDIAIFLENKVCMSKVWRGNENSILSMSC
jgi:hypothetical protein